MVDAALARRDTAEPPLVFTSANGQVLSMCASDPHIRDLFLAADLIHADGMPLVFVSRLFHKTPLPERVATTDLFHDVARVAHATRCQHVSARRRQGSDEPSRRSASARFIPISTLPATTAAICAARVTKNASSPTSTPPSRIFCGSVSARRPSMQFAMRYRDRLHGVGLIKTSGGLFDFLSGKNSRAPDWMQRVGLNGPIASILSRAGSPAVI